MPRRDDLQRLYRSPGSVSHRTLVAAIEARGWTRIRRAQGHDIYGKAGWPEVISLPSRLKGTGTIRRIVRQLQAEEASHE